MRFEFEWDPAKAASNLRKHNVAFEEAMTVFADPLALSLPDPDSYEGEERWITLAMSTATRMVLVVHTYVDLDRDRVRVRIISARRPTRNEQRQYEG